MIYGDLDGKFHCNTIFIQPTNLCAKNCEGCYVKAHCHGQQMDPIQHTLFQRLLYWREHISCNQITISMDSPGKEVCQDIYPFPKNDPRPDMVRCADFVLAHTMSLSRPDLQDRPSLHLTYNSMTDYWMWGWKPVNDCGVDVITFSNLNLKDGFLDSGRVFDIQVTGTKVNYNYSLPCTYPGMISDEVYDQELERIDRILKVVDSMYLIVWKEPVGRSYDLIEWGKYRDRIQMNLKWADLIQSEFRSPKIMMDTCVKDCLEWKKSGHGCSANVSRFQVWPDGSVSGCPYALQSCTGPASTAEKVVFNIRSKARESYDFDKCILKGLV